MARAAASYPAPCGPVSSTGSASAVHCDGFPQRADGGAVAEQRPFDAPARVGQQLLRHRQLAREVGVPGFELPAQALQRQVRLTRATTSRSETA
jgi:hypothetical protein